MKRTTPGVSHALSLLGAFVAASMVMGLLGAGIFMPIVGVAGLAAKGAVATFDEMPAQFTAPPMAQQSQILASDGSVLATLYKENRIIVPLDKIATVMQDAQIAIEDDRFYEHGGIDAKGLARAFVETVQGNKQGASTITQQFVKQTLITTALRNDDKHAAEAAQARGGVKGVVRKLQEAKYAIALEQKIGKQRVLEGYLNLVFYGAGAYGVEAAARRYFGVTAAKLTLPQAAMIAGMAQQPTRTNPFQFPAKAKERRDTVLRRMQQLGKISTRAMRGAIATPITLKPLQTKASCLASADPYFCEYIRSWLLDQPSLGTTRAEREKTLYYGGLRIKTTYDRTLTADVKEALARRVPLGRKNRGAAAAIVEPGTGKVLALAQNTDFTIGKSEPGKTGVNWTVDKRHGGANGFQIGSTAKMYGVVAALEKGMTAGSTIDAPADGASYSVRHLGGDKCGFEGGSFRVKNAESNEHGRMTLREATAKSVNTAFLELAARVGVCNEAAVMKKMGLHAGSGEDYATVHVSRAILGANEASPLTLAASYATLASGGTYCEPNPIEKITSFDNRDYPMQTAGCKQVLEPKVAYNTTRILQSVISDGTGRGLGLAGGRQAAGKTGTADDSAQTWFAGYTPQRAAAVWVGTPDHRERMPGVYGATIAGPLWQKAMNLASKGLPKERFRVSRQGGETVTVPEVAGRSRDSAESRLKAAGLSVEVAERRRFSSNVAEGRVVFSEPDGGEVVDKGEVVTLYLSAGPKPRREKNPNPSPSGDGASRGPTPKPSASATPTAKPAPKPTPKPAATTRPR